LAHIKESEGVDFQIQSPPLTEKERKEISVLIKKMKTKTSRTKANQKRKVKKQIVE